VVADPRRGMAARTNVHLGQACSSSTFATARRSSCSSCG